MKSYECDPAFRSEKVDWRLEPWSPGAIPGQDSCDENPHQSNVHDTVTPPEKLRRLTVLSLEIPFTLCLNYFRNRLEIWKR